MNVYLMVLLFFYAALFGERKHLIHYKIFIKNGAEVEHLFHRLRRITRENRLTVIAYHLHDHYKVEYNTVADRYSLTYKEKYFMDEAYSWYYKVLSVQELYADADRLFNDAKLIYNQQKKDVVCAQECRHNHQKLCIIS